MPVILPPVTWSVWLGEELAEPDQLKALLIPYVGEMTCWPVSQRVGNVKNNDASLIEPVASAVDAIPIKCEPNDYRGVNSAGTRIAASAISRQLRSWRLSPARRRWHAAWRRNAPR
jgi:hypothetical protein